MNINKIKQKAFTIIEMMIAMTIGLLVAAGIITIFLAQQQVYTTSQSQALMQNNDNAISQFLSRTIRGAGFSGCSNLTISDSIVNQTGPIVGNFNFPVYGFEAANTQPGNTVTVTGLNPTADSNPSDWNPNMDPSILSLGQVIGSSDIFLVNSAVPNTYPLGISSIVLGVDNFTAKNTTNLSVNNYASVSDCAKSTVFEVTGISGNTVTHSSGGAIPGNQFGYFQPDYPQGSQVIPMQQAVFFVGRTNGSDSALYEAVWSNGAWSSTPIAQNVLNMQVLYGIGSGTNTSYVTANNVSNWSQVVSMRIGLLLEGVIGSAQISANPNNFNLLGTTIITPKDSILRHTLIIDVNLRNLSSN